MKLITAILFQILIRYFQPYYVLDIGSLDGSEALRFRKTLNHARIIAFEANPNNIHDMIKDKYLRKNRIEIQNKVVWNKNGMINFYIEKLSEKSSEKWRKGISSTRKRAKDSLGIKKVSLPSIRLDSFMKKIWNEPDYIALWIDVEGSAFEVLEGIKGIKEKIVFIHVEVENQKVWENQKLESDILNLLEKMGFILFAEDFGKIQKNIIFINQQIYFKSLLIYNIIRIISFILSRFYMLSNQFLNLKRLYEIFPI